MTRQLLALGFATVTTLVAAGCGGNQPAPAAESTPASPAAPAPASAQGLDIMLTSQPDPPKMGENTFEAMVMQNGQPVTDADVSVMFFMAAMPSMNMAEMKNTVSLKHEGGGRYRGAGNVMMAGAWDTTVMVMRGGQEIGSRKVMVTAK